MNESTRRSLKDFISGWMETETDLRTKAKDRSLGIFGDEFTKGITVGISFCMFRLGLEEHFNSSADVSETINSVIEEIIEGWF